MFARFANRNAPWKRCSLCGPSSGMGLIPPLTSTSDLTRMIRDRIAIYRSAEGAEWSAAHASLREAVLAGRSRVEEGQPPVVPDQEWAALNAALREAYAAGREQMGQKGEAPGVQAYVPPIPEPPGGAAEGGSVTGSSRAWMLGGGLALGALALVFLATRGK